MADTSKKDAATAAEASAAVAGSGLATYPAGELRPHIARSFFLWLPSREERWTPLPPLPSPPPPSYPAPSLLSHPLSVRGHGRQNLDGRRHNRGYRRRGRSARVFHLARASHRWIALPLIICHLHHHGPSLSLPLPLSLSLSLYIYTSPNCRRDVIDTFGSAGAAQGTTAGGASSPPASFDDEVKDLVRWYCILAVVAGVGAALEMACWMTVGARQGDRVRSAYLRAAMRQDVAFLQSPAAGGPGGLIQSLNDDTAAVVEGMGDKVAVCLHNFARRGGGETEHLSVRTIIPPSVPSLPPVHTVPPYRPSVPSLLTVRPYRPSLPCIPSAPSFCSTQRRRRRRHWLLARP